MVSIKKYILEQVAKHGLSQDEAKKLLTELAAASRGQEDEIAIIGMAGRFPSANNADEYWEVLRNGLNCIRDFPEQRRQDFEHILRNPHYTEFLIGDSLRAEDIAHAHAQAGYLDEIDKFDANFFGIPPAEATYMDPHQRLALELAHEAMEDAGYGGQRLFGSNTGLYLGKEGTNYSLYRYTTVNNPMKLTGSWESIMVSRISYLFNFKGPCMLVDTACSAGLVSIHMAAQAILNGECDMALAGGINLSITGEFSARFQGSMAMDAVESKDATIRTFDARANGTVWGEGVAMVLLKPLSRALADRDPIHAIIKGSAINNDGAASGLTAPDAEAQEQVIVKAWQKAKIDPTSLSYVEAHGTGTVLGDPIEFKGLTAAFRRYTQKRQFCAIGSLKTNMGHLVAASGVASLFKVVKSLEHQEMAPTINFGKPNPYINFLSSPLYVNDVARRWDSNGSPRRAALSSFGFSHTNCHMVVQEAPVQHALPPQKSVYCFTLSAQTQEVLLDYVARFCKFALGSGWLLADVCHTVNVGRGHYAHRLAIVAANEDELRAALGASAEVIKAEKSHAMVQYQRHQIVSDKKKKLEACEITDRKKKTLSEQAAVKLEQFLVEGASERALLERIAAQYVEGGDVDWEAFYAGELRKRLSLPTYPFQRIRVWADPKISKLASVEQRIHPLVEQRSSSSEHEDVFESVFRADTHWVLSDHKIKGMCVVPGTTYLEMARVAARAAAHPSQTWKFLELRDVFFLLPMVVEAGTSRRVRVRLLKAPELLEFEIESAVDGSDDWQRHVEGKIGQCGPCTAAVLDLATLKAGATETIETFQAETDTGVFQFGPHWDAVRSAWRLKDDALAKLALQPALEAELAVFQLHPSVLDNAMNLISQSSAGTFLPYTYKSFKLFAPFCAPMYSHVVAKLHKGSGETLTYDVMLVDGNGHAIAQVTDYVVKKVNSFAGLGSAATGADGEYMATRWSPQTINAQQAMRPQHLLLLGATDVEQQALIAGLQQAGVEVTHLVLVPAEVSASGLQVEASEAGLARLVVSDLLSGIDGIIFATGAQAGLDDAADFSRQRMLGVDALFHLTKALLAAKVKLAWGLCVLTQNAYQVDGSETALNPLAAASAALGAVIGMEYSGLPCRLLDRGSCFDGAQLALQILDMPTGRQMALRGGNNLVRELYSLRLDDCVAVTVRADGVYLITGGLGGLGLASANFLASLAQTKVVLSGRSALAPRCEWTSLATKGDAQANKYIALLALSEHLEELDYIACDVADPTDVAHMLARLRAEHGALRGIFHLAGVAGEGFLLRKQFTQFDSVLKPKLDGLRNLYAASSNDQLDFLVCFSSITALTGGEGQGDYAAANAFMDAFAAQARQQGRTCIAINWPSWKEIGMAADFHVSDEQSPFAALSPVDAFERLQRVLAHGMQRQLTQILPSSINPTGIAQVRDILPFLLAPELQRRLADAVQGEGTELQAEDFVVYIRGKNDEDLSDTEVLLAKIYASVLGLAEIDVFTNFHDMGGNSIIATHLLKLIDTHFRDLVDISDIFSYSSIDEMASYITEKRTRMAPTSTGRLEDMLDHVFENGGSFDAIIEQI